MTIVFGLSARHIDTDTLRSDEGRYGVDGPGRLVVSECPTCRVMLPSSGYCDQCGQFVALT